MGDIRSVQNCNLNLIFILVSVFTSNTFLLFSAFSLLVFTCIQELYPH